MASDDAYRYESKSMLLSIHGMERSSEAWKTPARILEVRFLDPRGPAFPGDLITSGRCGAFDPVRNTVDVDLAPYDPPTEPIRVLLYVNDTYIGFATLGPDGFVQEEGAASPWLNIRSLLS